MDEWMFSATVDSRGVYSSIDNASRETMMSWVDEQLNRHVNDTLPNPYGKVEFSISISMYKRESE